MGTTFSYDTSLVEYGYEPVGRRLINDVSIHESNEILTGAETVQHLSRQNGKCETSLEEGNNAKLKISSKSFIDTLIDKVKLLSKEESKNVNGTENLKENTPHQDGTTFEEIDLKENTGNITVQNEGETKVEELKLDENQREKDQKMIMKNSKKEREEEIKRNKEEEKRIKKEKEQKERKRLLNLLRKQNKQREKLRKRR